MAGMKLTMFDTVKLTDLTWSELPAASVSAYPQGPFAHLLVRAGVLKYITAGDL